MALALLALIALLAQLALAACGGDSDGDGGGDDDAGDMGDAGGGDGGGDTGGDASGAPTRALAGRVVLPDGVGLALDVLRVQTAAAEAPLAGDGTFAVDAAIAGESLVFVLDGDDDIVLLGFVDPRSPGVIDAHSTATALLYLGLHLYAMPPDARLALLAEVRAHAATGVLAEAVASALAADAKALMGDGAALLPAVEDAILALTASSLTKSHRAEDDPILPPLGNNGLVTMAPEAAQSGVEVGPDPGGRGLQFVNRGRRAAWYYVYRTAVESTAGDVTELDPPVLLAQGLLSAPDRLEAGGGLEEILSGGLSYEPAPLPADVAIDVPEGQRRVGLEAIVAGAHYPGGSETPTWFDLGDPRHSEWLARAELLTRVSFVRDLLYPTLSSFVFPTDMPYRGGDDVDALAAIADELIAAAPAVGDALGRGEWGDALRSSLDAMARDQEPRVDVTVDVYRQLAPSSETTARFTVGRMQSSEFFITLHDLDSRSARIGVVFSELETANALERWEGEALRASVLLTPRRPTLDPPHLETDILATVPGAEESERFCYLWTLEEGPGELSPVVPGPSTGSPNQHLTDEATIEYAIEGNELNDGPLGLIGAAVYARPDGGCVFPPDEIGLIGEAQVRIEGSEEELIPCRGDFDFSGWQTYAGGVGLSLSGSAGGSATMRFNVPEDTTPGETGYRSVQVYFPMALEPTRSGIRVSGDARVSQIEDSDVIIRFLEEIIGLPVLLRGGASISLSARGPITITGRTRGYVASCRSEDPGAPPCCPYVTYIPDWNQVWSGALGYVSVPSVGFTFEPLRIP